MSARAGGAAGGSLESTLDKKFQTVTNTMESIQGLSTWCIDNKKCHSLIVRHWAKCLKKSDAGHRLNLFYLANDVIQNCKRKNAIVYRTAFAEVLPDAFLQINFEGDAKVIKAVERILSIWEERSVYSGALITELRSSLIKEESPPETPVEQKTPVESKADLRSKIVAEFVPQALIDHLNKHKKSLEEVDLREKQLTAMRVDICSSEALKKLKDKAGGKKFCRDFEEGSAQLQEFVKFFDKKSKTGPPLLEALANADIFYEMQYKEVKIVANAYQTFANRVSHLKRKLDSLKSTLPDLDESPIPSPSADAPSPTGSESPFRGLELANPDPDLDGSAMDDEAEPPAPSPLSSPGSPKADVMVGENDNREVEDMDLSDEETDSGGIIVEPQVGGSAHTGVSAPVSADTQTPAAAERLLLQATPPEATPAAVPATAVKGVDLGKIGSILNSLNSAIKNTGPLAEPPSAAPLSSSLVKTKPDPSLVSQDASSLVSLLSKVDVSPADLLGALAKVQGQSSREGFTSLLSSSTTNISSDSSSTGKILPSSVSTVPSPSASLSSAAAPSPSVRRSGSSQLQTPSTASVLVQALHRDMDLTSETEPASSSKSLESKIHSFLHGNPAFNTFDLGLGTNAAVRAENLSPGPVADTQDGTPVRDEGGGTPTQDEIMDKPAGLPPFSSSTKPPSVGETVAMAFPNSSQQVPQAPHRMPDVAQNGNLFQAYPFSQQEMPEHGITPPVAHYQPLPTQSSGPALGERTPGGANHTQTVGGFQGGGGGSESSWYGDTYPDSSSQQPAGYGLMQPVGAGANKNYPYKAEPGALGPQEQGNATSSGFYRNTLPPVPNLPPPPVFNDAPPTGGIAMCLPEQQQQPAPGADTGEGLRPRGGDSIISGMVIHDHQHKSMFHSGESSYELERHRHHPEDIHPRPDDLQYQDDHEHYHEGPPPRDDGFFQEDPYCQSEDQYYRSGDPPHHYPRDRGRLTPPPAPADDVYFAPDYQWRSPPPRPHYAPRRPPPPPHLEIRHPGPRPPHRPAHPPYPPHPARHPHPRGPPRAPFPPFHGPNLRLRGKRPGPRGPAGPMFPPKRPFPPPRY